MNKADLDDWDWKPFVSCLHTRHRRNEKFTEYFVRRLKETVFGIPAPKWPEGMEHVFDEYVKVRAPHVALAEFAPNGICAMNACQRHNIPIVVHFHGYDASSLLRLKSYRKCLPELFEKSAAVVTVSQMMRTTLEDLGCPPSKLHVIPCGAPVEEFQVSDTVENQPCKFIAVSSLLPVKGIFFTLRAFAECSKKCPDVTLTIIGAGKYYQRAKKWIHHSGLSQKIHLLGYQPNKIVREYMSKSSVIVQHSVTVRIGFIRKADVIEGWGISLAEGASTGLPVIATNHGGIPDMVIDEKTGFLIAERDWRAMAQKMIFLAENPNKRKEMGLAGRKNIEVVGNTKLQILKLLNVLRTAVNPAGK
jgi:colanic acid/amylovoran biosynthesis glycosyltransferase